MKLSNLERKIIVKKIREFLEENILTDMSENRSC